MIDFVAASEGCVVLFANDKVVAETSNPTVLADVISRFGFADRCYQSSTMDFADEEGFDTYDGASKLLEEAIAISGV